jgi:hypothetical protein
MQVPHAAVGTLFVPKCYIKRAAFVRMLPARQSVVQHNISVMRALLALPLKGRQYLIRRSAAQFILFGAVHVRKLKRVTSCGSQHFRPLKPKAKGAKAGFLA